MDEKSTKNIIIEELMKNMQQKLIELDKNPTSITVTLKEDDYDMFDDFSDAELKKGVELSSGDYKHYFHNMVAKSIGSISYNLETSYMGFHYFAWKELQMIEKVATVLWFNQVLAQKSNKESTPIIFNPFVKDVIDHKFVKDMQDCCFIINPLKLTDKNLLGFEVMQQMMLYNFQDDLNIALAELNNGENYDRFDELTLANCLKQIKMPENYQAYLYAEDVSEEEEKDIALFASQPIEIAKRKVFDDMNDYMELCEEVVGVPDTVWQNSKLTIEEDNKTLDTLYQHYFKEDKQELFKNLLKNELAYVNSVLEKQDIEK